eukprot:TRINITY_DN17027_c0_g4_i1.p1 TRINITY_DN17027_c0_g4~~TRINITY_DN17027_c0_g4_i1.p1  ORF type:complete len:772 (-),score=137.59 TRINITY_DN17027_c0_g4_i1:56-2311(-)
MEAEADEEREGSAGADADEDRVPANDNAGTDPSSEQGEAETGGGTVEPSPEDAAQESVGGRAAAAFDFVQHSEAVAQLLPLGPRVCILGGTAFKNLASETIVKALGQAFAERLAGRVVVLTGGMPGVQQTFAVALGDAFPALVHLLPEGNASGFGVGMDVAAGATLPERMAIFGQLGDVYIVVEGGPGAASEAAAAFTRGALVLPLMTTGGASSGMFNFPADALQRPACATDKQWSCLRDPVAPEVIAAVVVEIIESHVGTKQFEPVGSVGESPPAASPVPEANPATAAEPQARAEPQRRIWRPGHNKCENETDSTKSWYLHKRHLLIFTYSGKPVYTRYGCEEGLVTTTGALSAIVAKMQGFFFATGNGQSDDSLRYMMAGDHIFVFLERGPLWLVCITRTGDEYREIVQMLERVHLQIITILTAGIERTLENRPNYDMRSLLGGTDCVVNNMVRWCTQDIMVDGFEPLPLAPAHRSSALDALKAVRLQNILCAFLLAGHRILSIIANRQFKVNALDLNALINLIMSSASLRTVQSWIPICLVHLNDKAFAYAYISYVEGVDLGVVFLSGSSDGDQFYAISQQATQLKETLQKSGCIDAAVATMQRCPVDFKAAAASESTRTDRSRKKSLFAPFPAAQWRHFETIIHAAYFLPSVQQFFSSAIAPYHDTRRRSKMLFRSYGRCRALLRKAKRPAQICVATDHECFYVFLAADFHLYLTVPRGTTTGVIGHLYQWFRSQESHLFVGSIPTW